MKLRQFLSVICLVALVGVIFSPSTLSLTASPGGDGGTGPADTSSSGTSMFLAYLRESGYHVTVANTSLEVTNNLLAKAKLVYVLVGADTALSNQDVQAVSAGYAGGSYSALIAEGNYTNAGLLATFGASATGSAIVDPASSFQDQRVFSVDLSLGSTNASGVIDIASPLRLAPFSFLHPVAVTSPASYDAGNSTVGPRAVVAAGSSPSGSKAVILTDSAPFTNFLFNYTQGAIDERAFVAAMLSYVDPGKATPVLVDASHYYPAKPPPAGAGLAIGPLVAYILEQYVSTLNGYYASLPADVSGWLGGIGIHVSDGVAGALVALLILLSVYGAVTRWFAPEKKGKDDQPLPNLERTVVAESKARTGFLQASRSKEGYVATLAQLYEVLDSIVLGEFGVRMASLDATVLAKKVGGDEARRAKKLFVELSRLHEYAVGRRRRLFPPVIRWRRLTARTTGEAEDFLDSLGVTIAGEQKPLGQGTPAPVTEMVRA